MAGTIFGRLKLTKPGLARNPVVIKELRGRMRGNRAMILLTLYLLLLSLVLSLIYLAYRASTMTPGSVSDRQILGKMLFATTVWLELLTVSFVAPALTAGGISSERERQTYDLLRTTLLPARSLVMGKFFAGLSFLLLLLVATLPLQSLAFLFGGVALEEVLIATVLLLVTAITFCAVGIFVSSLLSRTLVSTVLGYAFTILMVFGLPALMFIGGLVLGGLTTSMNQPLGPVQEIMLAYGGWILISTNPLSTALATELILLEEQSIWTISLPLNQVTVTMISPWIPFTIFFLIFSAILLALSVAAVRRAER